MNRRTYLIVQICLTLLATLGTAWPSPPDDFPRFQVPGHEKEMATVRELFWLHYPGAGPKATLWDECLPDASLWPAVSTENKSEAMRQAWPGTLSARILDPEGYVATHQHASIAHQLGWPFPFWNQGRRGCGWHFSFKNTAGPGWRPHDLSKPNGWTLAGARDAGVNEDGWRIEVTNIALRLNWGDATAVRLVRTNAAPAKIPAEREAFFKAQPSKAGEFRATWIHSAYGIEGWGWDKTIATLKSNGFNAIIPNLLWAGVAHEDLGRGRLPRFRVPDGLRE